MTVNEWKTKLRGELARQYGASTQSIKLVPQPVRRKGGIKATWEPLGEGRVVCPINGKTYAVYRVMTD